MLAKHLSKSEEAQAFRKNKWTSFQVDTCCSNPPHKISCRNSCFHGRLPHLFQVNRWIILQKVKLNRFTKPPLRKVNIVWLIIMKFFLWNGIPEILRACKLIVIRKPKNVRSLWSRVTQRKVLSWYLVMNDRNCNDYERTWESNDCCHIAIKILQSSISAYLLTGMSPSASRFNITLSSQRYRLTGKIGRIDLARRPFLLMSSRCGVSPLSK